MTILCESCSRPIWRESCSPQCSTSVSRLEFRTPKSFRSTKSASKARRDQINAELQILRSLLPISEQDKERLSYLHTMALVCFHIRQTQLFLPETQWDTKRPAIVVDAAPVIDPELLLSIPGFILALTANGKLAYISENVSHFLGFSVVELLAHGDSIFDLLSSTTNKDVQEKLCFAQQYPGTEIKFITEMRTMRTFWARYGKTRGMAIRGKFVMLTTELISANPTLTFVAFCTPVRHLTEDGDGTYENSSFKSQHTLNMKIADVNESVVYHLGYQKGELIGQSWYNFLHPEDIGKGVQLHRSLVYGAVQQNQQTVVRVVCKDLTWAWVRVVALKESGKEGDLVTCTNHILSEEEALYIQSHETEQRETSPSPITPTLSSYAQEGEHQIQPKENCLFPQDPVIFSGDTPKYNPCSLFDGYEDRDSPASLHLPTSFSGVKTNANIPTWRSPQLTEIPIFPAGRHKNISCLDGVNSRQPSFSPYPLCSPESVLRSESSFSEDSSPLSEETSSTEMFPVMDTSSDPDRKTINMLAEQFHSLAEIFSQFAKQLPYGTSNISLRSGRLAEDTHMGTPLDWHTSGNGDVPEDEEIQSPLDEEIISYILTNLLDNDTLNLSTCDLGSSETFNMTNSDMELSLHQIPVIDGTPCPDQCLLQGLSDFQMLESQWDGKFCPTLQQGEEG